MKKKLNVTPYNLKIPIKFIIDAKQYNNRTTMHKYIKHKPQKRSNDTEILNLHIQTINLFSVIFWETRQ